jgi:hypothetical protein
MYLDYLFLIILQEKIDTATVEGVESVGEEECIKTKAEQLYIQLVRAVKSEQEVSVLCCVVVCVCVCMCVVLYIVFSYAVFSYVHITSVMKPS